MTEIRDCPGPDPDPRRPAMAMPPLACDTHAHVFDAARYPYQPVRGYTPPDNDVNRLLALHDALGIARGVVVQASVHGTDNRAVLDAASAHPDRLRAIVAVSEGVTKCTDNAVVGSRRGEINKQITSPCGVCRQALFEFGGPELNVIMAKSPDDFIERSMDELLPFGFGPSNVAGNKAVED